MDIELRWILIAISIVVLVLIVFDGWRRIKRQQKSLIHSNFDELPDESLDEVSEISDELPELDEVVVMSTKTNMEPPMIDEDELVEVKKTSIVIDDTIDIMPNTLFVLNILASQGSIFSGSQLLPALLSLGLRYGDMSIFHRHEHINGNGAILFSLASATEPGIFNLNTMESQNFTGLTLFLQVPGPTHPTNALNLMVQTAKRLAKALDGHVYDDERQLLNDTNLERRYYFRLRQILGKI